MPGSNRDRPSKRKPSGTQESAAREALEDAAKDLAKIANEKPMTKEQAEEISKRST